YPNAQGVTQGVSSRWQGQIEDTDKVRKAYTFETVDKPDVVLDYYSKTLTTMSPNPWHVGYSAANETAFYVFGLDLGHTPFLSAGKAHVIVGTELGANARTRVQVIETVNYR